MEPMIGMIVPFGFNFAPRGWAQCNGQLLSIAQYNALFSLLGTYYGGDGSSTFALPDLRGRAPKHFGTGPGLSAMHIGERGGAESMVLAVANMPAHSHAANATKAGGTSSNPRNNFWAADDDGEKIYSPGPGAAAMASGAIGSTGGGQSFTLEDPYLAVNWCIALEGTYPSRS